MINDQEGAKMDKTNEEVIAEVVNEQDDAIEAIELSETEKLQAEVESLKHELDISKNAYFKAYADTENTKRRLQSEFEKSNKYKLQSFGTEVISVLDSLERALQVETENEEISTYVKGFKMIYDQLIEILKQEGIEAMNPLDQPFDPNFHHAIMQEAVEGKESGMVIEVLQKGYMLKDRILRAALVKVSE